MSVWNALPLRRPYPAFTISRATAISIAASIAFAVITLLALDAGNDLVHRFYFDAAHWKIYIPVIGATVAAAIFYNTRYNDFSGLLKACLRASAAGLLVLLIVEAPDFSLGRPEAARALAYVNDFYPFALVFAVAGLIRPSFVIPTVIYIASTRHLVYDISSLPMSFIDIRYMLDMALYLAIFGIAVVKLGPRIHPWLGAPERQSEIVGIAMGLHLANYFWSGVAKLEVGPTPWYWMAENATYNQVPYTIESGIMPFGHIPWLSQFAYDFLAFFNTPLNVVIVFVQLFAVLCVLKISWLKVTSILFDLLHIGIYVFGGLFFWPWIWNNLTIWWAARSQKKQGLALQTKVACITAVLLGAPFLHINPAAWLAWFDVADARQIRFEAVTEDGQSVRVPSAFFVNHSYSVSHGYMGHQGVEGHYDGTQLASTDSVERNELSGTCAPPSSFTPERAMETEEERLARQATLGSFLAFHHDKMLGREAAVGRGSWYFHAHHHPSNPFLYDEFNALSLKNVIGYNLVLESVCLSMKDGHVEKKVLARTTEFYDVR
jgi:hypothetical protein